MLISLLASALSLLPTTRASTSLILNSCTFPIHIYYSASTIVYFTTLSPGTNLSGPYPYYSTPYLLTPKRATNNITHHFQDPHTVFNVFLPQTQNSQWDVLYGLYDNLGDVFEGHKVQLRPSNESCKSVIWQDGRSPGGAELHKCYGSANLRLEFCGE